MTKDIFSTFTQAVVKKLHDTFETSRSLQQTWDLQTLVRVRTTKPFEFLPVQKKLTLLPLKIDQIIEEDQDREYTLKTSVRDYQKFSLIDESRGAGHGGHGGRDGGHDGGQDGGQDGHRDSVDTAEVTLMKEFIEWTRVKGLRMFGCTQLKVKANTAELIQLQPGERLAYVSERFYSSQQVQVWIRTSVSRTTGSELLHFSTAAPKEENPELRTFSVPEQTVLLFRLQEVNLQDDVLSVPKPICGFGRRELLFSGIRPVMIKIKEQYNNNNENVLKPLSELPKSGRSDLLNKLLQVLEDREVLQLLEDKLDGDNDVPQSELLVSFMDLLSGSKDLREAAQLLVSALNVLPDDTPALLAKCDSETLKFLQNQMERLVEVQEFLCQLNQPSVESPLVQEKEVEAGGGGGRLPAGLSWLENFFSSVRNLQDLRSTWDCPDFSPEGLLEVLYLSVRGLILLQP